MSEAERRKAYVHLRAQFPAIERLIEQTGELPLPKPANASVAASLVHIVAGQMLSRKAATSILKRMTEAAKRTGRDHLYHLTYEELRDCGLSGRKARTIAAVADLAANEGERLEGWRKLEWEALRTEVSSIWGLSDWSASVLAIFDFGLPDIFPLTDGSLARAIRLLEEHHLAGELFQHDRATPYGSYLAITLWAALDDGHLTAAKAA